MLTSNMCFSLPHDWHLVPDREIGIYMFRFRFPTDYELGLTADAEEHLKERAVRAALFFFKRCSDVSRIRKYRGTIALENKANHISDEIFLEGERSNLDLSALTAINMFESGGRYDNDELKAAVAVLRRITSCFPPLYVGMTREQSLQVRLVQHLAGETTFARRLQEFEIAWQSVHFCIEPINPRSKCDIRAFEKLFQVASNPIFSDA